MALTREDLDRIGLHIAPEQFDALIATAVRAMPAVAASDSRHDLSAEEAAALQRGGFDLTPEQDKGGVGDPLAVGAAEYATLVSTALTPAQAATQLGIDSSRVRHRLAARTLYGVKTPHGWRLPRFQFDPASGRVLAGIGVVLAMLDPDLHPVSVQRWFLLPDPDLAINGMAVSPRDWLRQGRDPRAIAPLTITCRRPTASSGESSMRRRAAGGRWPKCSSAAAPSTS
jgi:hypothetical protein